MVLAEKLRHIELQQHEYARSNDAVLLDFLSKIRDTQPSKDEIAEFFGNRRLAEDLSCRVGEHIVDAVGQAIRIEAATGKMFTFLTVTNRGSLQINHTRCAQKFNTHEHVIHADRWRVPGDPSMGGGDVVAIPGMR
eukprot:1650592-Karenia_brevis.AAC.1